MFLRQFCDPETSTFTYVLGCLDSRKACIIDPVFENHDLYLKLLNEWQLSLLYSLETHTHADHITAATQLKQSTNCSIGIPKQSQATGADETFDDGTIIHIGKLKITALFTPGHTDDCYCFLCEDCVFTGDTLLIRATGRTDFQAGNAKLAYHSITEKLLTLPDATRLFPGHDYKILNESTIGEEKQFNPRLQVSSADEYAAIMEKLNLPLPKNIKSAVTANLHCGNITDNKENQHV
ncbi:MAG: MBL fold metallo-hydrolase [Gammaproteobacteria bacterium]|nr:MBL fold metallo-hydrolase [Gammaproteobacteria bacterium]MCH9744199.1 MBL fold metallo-hydrolase [Gammaproteobacteria bacterium]